MPIKVLSADFVKTATRRAEWPQERLPEVAFVGRSNVGKSSLLNALARRDGLARVSATPGRTQALQFFRVEAQASDREALGFLAAQGRRVLVAATKMDKLSKSHRNDAARVIANGLGLAR